MTSRSQPLLLALAEAADDLLAQPSVKSRLVLLFRELADCLEADGEQASSPMTHPSEPEEDVVNDPLYANAVEDRLHSTSAANDDLIATQDTLLDRDQAIERLREGLGTKIERVEGIVPIGLEVPEGAIQGPTVALSTLAQRFSLKAEACRMLATTGHLPDPLCERAQKASTRLWMREFMAPERLEWMQHLGESFETAADAALLLEKAFPVTLDSITHRHQDVVDAVAHVSSILLSASLRMQGKHDLNVDPDVRDFHRWLEFLTQRYQIYQERYMKFNALAPLKSLPDAQKKLQALKDSRGKAEREYLSGLKAYLKQIAAESPGSAARRLKEVRFLEKIESARTLGWQPSRLDLRKLLSAWYDALPRPEDPPPFYTQLLGFVDDQYREQPDEETDEDEDDLQPSKTPNIDRVRMLLHGKALYIVGGNPVPAAMERIKKAFGLSDVLWPETQPHTSVDSLRPTVSRPEVAAVLLLVRFASHTFGQLIEDCERTRKPFVRIPNGYGVKQIAYQILAQASHQLT